VGALNSCMYSLSSLKRRPTCILHTKILHSDPREGRFDVGPRATHLLGIVVVSLRGASEDWFTLVIIINVIHNSKTGIV
jgi:hypothetical protein